MLKKTLYALLATSHVFSQVSDEKIKTIYSSLDPLSVSQNFAFYELYPESPYGKKALQTAFSLLLKQDPLKKTLIHPLSLPVCDIQGIIAFVNRQSYQTRQKLSQEQLNLSEILGSHLANRKLKGSKATSLSELLALPDEEIDIGRAILLQQFHDLNDIKEYEANLDFIALQIQAKLPSNPTPEEKIKAINTFIFHEMQFRFPPHSLYAKDIDLYTFLPSVLDSRHGVCLGVSILFLSIAQRLHLPLEIITPPGHIYLRYQDPKKLINIETTARGIDLPSEVYLGLNTKLLHQRTLKEVIGLALVNQASTTWERGDYKSTVELYEKAQPFLKEDPLLKMLLGLNYLFIGKKDLGKKLLAEIKGKPFVDAIAAESMPEDYLNGKVDIEGLKTIFLPVNETRESIIEKQQKLQKVLKRYPKFRAGLMQLSITWMQLGRRAEALACLQNYHKIDSKDPVAEYYLVHLYLQSLDFPKAWHHFSSVLDITKAANHHPQALKELHHILMQLSPKSAIEKEKESLFTFFKQKVSS